MKKMLKSSTLSLSILLAACGGGGGSSPSATTTTPPASAILNDAPVKGVCYSAAPSGLRGTTDATGAYQFNPGDNVSFWIDVSGGGCGTTPANYTSTTAIALGSVIPGTATGTAAVQTFILSLDTGPQAAQTLQALNHGTASAMDVSGLTLPAAQVTAVNNFLVTKGDATVTPSVVTLFTNAQAAATLPAATALTLPVTATFEATVNTNLATTVTTGLGTAPTTLTIPANRIQFGSSSGSQSVNGGASVPFNGASFQWYDGAGNAIRKVSPGNLDTQITTANIASSGGNVLCSITQPATYTIAANVVSKNYVIKDSTCTQTGTISDTTTVAYADDHGSFFSGTSVVTSGVNTINRVYSGSSVKLTPLTPSMVAGKSVTFEAPGCPNGTSTNTFSPDGVTMTNANCGGEVRTNTALTDVPGIIRSMSTGGTNPDQSVILIGLDGPSVAVGSTFVVLTLNRGLNPDGSHSFPAWGRMKILAVQ
jgi:hypothetical protein